ncbi:hypothetical protein NP493_856g01005 [Ridgeia piscesae]|uniref:Nipped-B protein n=1 Tax=Ridgeia piscesae TaxID=27915 RepID=A0AAD9KLS8_RIDPI|nr:hypothetical protein NP493_856g01005 [Ridgeia piscesae]
MCVRMIRRVNDEEGIKLFKKEENSNSTPVEQACEQIINCLVENVLRIEEHSAEAGTKQKCNVQFTTCFNTLYLFCKVKPELLIPDANTIQPYLNIKCSVSIRDEVFDVMLYFIRHEDEEVKHKALAGLGFFVMREYEYMLGQDIRELYIDLLTRKEAPVKMRCQVLRNMLMYLMEEEARMIKADQESTLVLQIKAMTGIKMSYRLQKILQQDPSEPIRGIRTDDDNIISLNSFIYSLIRSNRGQRRAMLQSLLNMFDETGKAMLSELIYMADNMAFLPYKVQDEPLYIIHQIDIIVSVSGSNILQSYKEVFFPGAADDDRAKLEDDDDEELNTLLERMPEDTTALPNLFMMSQGCILLLMLKQHLKELYRFTDSKIHRYSPTEQAKVWDKPLNRKAKMTFNPSQAMDLVREGTQDLPQDDDTKTKLIQGYLDVSALC